MLSKGKINCPQRLLSPISKLTDSSRNAPPGLVWAEFKREGEAGDGLGDGLW